jgi:ATP-binding protein involved in chromosome partitioning
VAAELGIPFLGQIPFDPRMAVAGDRGVPLVAEHPDSPAAQAFFQIAAQIKGALGLGVSA